MGDVLAWVIDDGFKDFFERIDGMATYSSAEEYRQRHLVKAVRGLVPT